MLADGSPDHGSKEDQNVLVQNLALVNSTDYSSLVIMPMLLFIVDAINSKTHFVVKVDTLVNSVGYLHPIDEAKIRFGVNHLNVTVL